jgi:hypothetical protein
VLFIAGGTNREMSVFMAFAIVVSIAREPDLDHF